MAQKKTPFTGLALSGFCMQVSLLYQAAVPLYEGLSVMAEDAHSDEEKRFSQKWQTVFAWVIPSVKRSKKPTVFRLTQRK